MNRHLLAAQLRRRATHLDRHAWKIEKLAHARQTTLVKDLRQDAQALRRLADKLAPKA